MDSQSLRAQAVKRYIMQAVQDLPPLPAMITKILEETQKEDVSASTLEKLLSSDQALAVKTLRVVNSAYYGLEGQVSSLSQAVVILGIQQLRNLVLSVSAIGMLNAKNPRQQQLQREFWLHSIATASTAQVIAQKKRFSAATSELIFVGGLLHDLGRLFLYTNFTDQYQNAEKEAQKTGLSLIAQEEASLGVTHTDIGLALGSLWKFPKELVMYMSEHEGPFDANSDSGVMAVHVSDKLAQRVMKGGAINAEIDGYVDNWLGFDEAEIQAIEETIGQRMSNFQEMYQMMAA
ncbi:MAG: HDOD domain-containing protein [Fimbriimonadaceae bacterium]|nr:HDOD domain-containing protein [Fimbriimonadaceae bacterium]